MKQVSITKLIESFRNNRFRVLKIKLFFIIGAIAGAPLLMVSVIAYLWLYGIAKDDFAIRFTEKIETTSLSMDYYISEKLSGLQFLASAYSYESLSEQKNLNNIFHLFKREFGELVDLGVIDDKGIQKVYAGPFQLQGKNYATHEWYEKTIARGRYVSDVFIGYRNIPHFAIAVKKYIPSKATFCILRATINMESLNNRIAAMGLKGSEDAFLISSQNILQTDTRFYGKSMERLVFDVIDDRRSINKSIEIREITNKKGFIGHKKLENVDWHLVIVTSDSPHDKIIDLLRHNYTMVYLTIAVMVMCIILNFNISRRMVNWIQTSEKNREDAIAQSEHANRLASIGRLAAGVAHEINNPLAIINEKAGLMKDILNISGATPHKDKFLGLIAAISDSVNRCRTITHRLLGFARQMDINMEMIDINSLIKDVLQFLEKEITYRDIKLELILNDEAPLIESDRGQLQQVFLNIINNAIDAVQDEGIISIKVDFSGGDSISISIQDNGHGIQEDKLKQIFEPFYTTKEKGKGTGLGLSITYGIVQKLGGDIRVESKVGIGTKFTVELPLKNKNSREDAKKYQF